MHESIEYLGHTISSNGFIPDKTKIEAMIKCLSNILKAISGFLGLTK